MGIHRGHTVYSAVHAMLGLVPGDHTLEVRVDLIVDVDECLMQPIEQTGLDVIDFSYGADW